MEVARIQVSSAVCRSTASTFHPSIPVYGNNRLFGCTQNLKFPAQKCHSQTFISPPRCSSKPLSEMDMGSSEHKNEDFLLKKLAIEMIPDLRGTSLFLIGAADPQKSTVGSVLSKALGYFFFDSEKIVQQASGGYTNSHKLREEDEEGFRDSESEVLRQLSSMGRLVVSTSSDVVLRLENLGLMRHGVTVWLDLPLEPLAKQVMDQKANAISETYPQVLERLTKHFDVRKKGYAIADLKISLQNIAAEHGYQDMLSLSPTLIAIEVLKSLRKLVRYKKLQEAAAAPEIQWKES